MTNNYVEGTIRTYTGRYINPLEPDPKLIDIVDIAHALSNQCRFTGHTRDFYSVAQHSVHVAEEFGSPEADLQLLLTALLHDASEAYLADLASPVKRSNTLLAEEYRVAEDRLMQAVSETFPILYPLPDSVHQADREVLMWEQAHLMRSPAHTMRTWSPHESRFNFLQRYNTLALAMGLPQANQPGRLGAIVRSGLYITDV